MKKGLVWYHILLSFIIGSFFLPAKAEIEEPIIPLASDPNAQIDEKSLLGGILFHDKRLSRDNTLSCSSCHDLAKGGVDGRERSIGLNGALGDINAPTVYNSGLNFRQFWNGRAKTLEDQIDGPVQHPKEMGGDWDKVVAKLNADQRLLVRFKKVFGAAISRENIKDSIASFERKLVTANSRFDRFLRGERQALTSIEESGYQKFKAYGCVACHQGMNVGGNMFQTMGVMGNYFKDRGTPITNADLGRFTVTKNEQDKHLFRVPSLRNVELTSPYFHDGSAMTLEEAIKIMAKYQLGKDLSEDDVKSIAAFLRTLTGQSPPILETLKKELEGISS